MEATNPAERRANVWSELDVALLAASTGRVRSVLIRKIDPPDQAAASSHRLPQFRQPVAPIEDASV
jgi:hypothetical protein